MIHEAFTKSEVAKRYYDLLGQDISRDQARKNFHQDKKIDKTVLKKVIDEIYKEAVEKVKAMITLEQLPLQVPPQSQSQATSNPSAF